ncbi:hypothetical protein TWF173_007827 [Orbilia oligospora]|nr:hypothetical protein TWF173_007827 [Orbilia oligospora]
MVSTRTKGSPVVMLDDHDKPVQQPTASPTKPGNKPSNKQYKKPTEDPTDPKSKTQTRKSIQKPSDGRPEDKTVVTKSTRSTRRNPNPAEPEVAVLSEPEQILQKRSPRKIQNNPQPPKTTASKNESFDLPPDNGEIQSTPRASGKVVKYKGRNVVLKALKANPTPTIEVEIIEQNGKEANGGREEQEVTAEGDDGDDERDEDDLPDVDDTLGGSELRVGAQVEDAEYVPEVEVETEQEPGKRPKKLGRPPKGNERSKLNPPKTRKRNSENRQPTKKKRRNDIGENYGDYDDESEIDEDRLRKMRLGECEAKLIARMTSMQQELTITYSNMESDRKSIQRRLKAADYIMMDTVKDFNDLGIYNGIAIGKDDPNYRTAPPRILRGDPFPQGATDFDANHPAIQALFPDERMAYEAEIFTTQLDHIEEALDAVNSLHKISERIWLLSVKYRTLLQRQRDFLKTCKSHAEGVKKEYIARREEESEFNREPVGVRTRPWGPVLAKPERLHRREEQIRGHPAKPSSPAVSRKRRLDVPDTVVSKRPRPTLEQGRPSRQYESSASESASVGGPSTPPPADRVVVELFGDHTPGRTRRIHQHPAASTDQTSGRPSGIHDDNAPWTSEENNALDGALRQIREGEGRWRLIKAHFGGPGTVLSERSSREIREKAWEYKMRIENSGQDLPDYWKNIGDPSDYKGED